MDANRIRERLLKKFLYVYTGPNVKNIDFLPNVI